MPPSRRPPALRRIATAVAVALVLALGIAAGATAASGGTPEARATAAATDLTTTGITTATGSATSTTTAAATTTAGPSTTDSTTTGTASTTTSTAPAVTPGTVTVSATPVSSPLPAGFLGFSLEYSALHQYVGRDPAAPNPVFLNLVRGLSPGHRPVLRIGGNSTDASWWPFPGVAPPDGVAYPLTADWLAIARATAAKLDARLILGVNLAADMPSLAAVEARALTAGIGRRYLEAIEIGNEPDLYASSIWYRDRNGLAFSARPPGYDFSDYLAEFTQWQRLVPAGLPLAGPAFALGTWMVDLPQLLAAEPTLRLVTFHRYPLRSCAGVSPLSDAYPTIANLLNDHASLGLAEDVAPFVEVAHAAGRPFRLDELNSSSCEGTRGVSNAFASSLWVLDTLMDLAGVGVDGVNLHTLPGSNYAPFRFTDDGRRGWTGVVNPVYYGMLMFTRAFPAGARMLAVSSGEPDTVKAFATLDPAGAVRVVLVNLDPLAAAPVSLTLPGANTAPLSVQALTAPSLGATSGVTLGGVGFGARTRTGVLPVHTNGTLTPASGAYSVVVPPGTALLLSPS